MIISGYHFQQKTQFDDKISKNDDKKMVKNPLFKKQVGKTRFHNHLIKCFKYQYVEELKNH